MSESNITGAGEAEPESVYQAVVRIIDESIPPDARPADAVIRRIALASAIAAWCGFERSESERDVLERAIDRMGWDEINAFHAELRHGQGVREDAGGFFMRAIRRLFGLPQPDPVENYRDAARRLVAEHYSAKQGEG